MSLERLSQQVSSYVTWKRDLMREITRYRSWLVNNRLSSPALEEKLDRALKLIRSDHITLAFVGEYSRGKTELINSLLFSSYGQRVLPSNIGRTTMCPTELFFDAHAERAYIRLLPIETRSSDANITQFKKVPRHWVNISLDPKDPEGMVQALSQLARTKTMPLEQALALGFQQDMLESANKSGEVLVPAWRHALINIDHPLLRNGLRILDTPGLNALGSEPELTLSMLPSAQAIIFILAADTGVTASDMAVWQQHIRQLDDITQANLFAVLNKIDVLWDDLSGEAFVQNAIYKMQHNTAKQLGIRFEDVVPLSAKQAMLAKARNDLNLLSRSQLPELENLLSTRIIARKEQLLEQRVVNQVITLLQGSQHALGLRLQKVNEQLALLSNSQQDNGQLLTDLTARTKQDHTLHHKRLLGLRTNQRLLRRQGEMLKHATRGERLNLHMVELRKALASSWTTLGINKAIRGFFASLEADLSNLSHEAQMANKMVTAIYRHYNDVSSLNSVDAPHFNAQRYQRELEHLRDKADRFRLQLRTVLTEQHRLSKLFFATLVREVVNLYQRLNQDIAQWTEDALMPLLQHNLENKQLLENHMSRLKGVAQETLSTRERCQRLVQYSSELEQQLALAGDILRALRRPAPIQRQGKVVTLPGAIRSKVAE
ncbi:dynamin family protein [Pseudomonas sp. TTU2014-080ASC]|uniref:dynamin family protein n=1 Tax=Pseudomonas sp. TTU2014-080ASC TaxID=1729724 RepID=UPI00071860E2|nr:dynamin family protein [Pseudomonas sp. TTU2014-080ASC]KRW61549.1 GTPase [Pseudomonas sp. TTU2014-080ASC]